MQFKQRGEAYYVKLGRGEEVVQGLTDFAREVGLETGSVVGIGAVEGVELGYYELATRTYHRRTFADDYELVNLTGNFSTVDGGPFLHAHVTIGDADFRAHCGHLFRAGVSVTGEFVVTPLAGQVLRCLDDSVGLKLWDLS